MIAATSTPLDIAPTAHAPRPDRPATRHRLSQWHAVPAAGALAARLAPTRVRPWQVSGLGLSLNLAAAVMLVALPGWRLAVVAALWCGWLCDRLDGALARRQGSASRYGAWLDDQLDELGEVIVHAAMAWHLALVCAASWPWMAFAAFIAGKYLLVAGLRGEESLAVADRVPVDLTTDGGLHRAGLLRGLYHAPGDADVRVHLLLAAIALGWFAAELVFVAAYYNVRWIARHVLVARRLAGRSM